MILCFFGIIFLFFPESAEKLLDLGFFFCCKSVHYLSVSTSAEHLCMSVKEVQKIIFFNLRRNQLPVEWHLLRNLGNVCMLYINVINSFTLHSISLTVR